MIIIDDIIVSDDIVDEHFVCNLHACYGSCCIEGDEGAPLDEEEIGIIEDELDNIKPYMTPKGIEVVNQYGVFDYGISGEYVTPLVNDRECAFVVFSDGIAFCAIEKAWLEKKIKFQKPISCHLYPIRIKKLNTGEALNYHKWKVCEPARIFGKQNGVPVYKFLKEPLIRKYGEIWYKKLEGSIKKP